MTPVSLSAEQAGDGVVTLVVEAATEAACTVRFRLEAISRGNRVDQRGTAALVPGRTQMLARVAVSACDGWHATLTVEPDGAEAYVIRRSAADGA